MPKIDSNPDTPQIQGSFAHCGKCETERPSGISPRDWTRTQCIMTQTALQIWCNRHNCNVALFEFPEGGGQLPAVKCGHRNGGDTCV